MTFKLFIHKFLNSKTQKLIAVGSFLFLAVVLLALHAIYSANLTKEVYINIPHNSSLKSVMQQLAPFLKSTTSFKWVARRKNYPNKIKSGRYFLEQGMSNNSLINRLRSGKQKPIIVIFNNQNSLEKLAAKIAEQIEPDSSLLIKAMLDTVFLKQYKLNKDNALSIYIPNSYEIYWNISADKFRDKMYQEYLKFWQQDKRLEKAKALNLDKEEVIALAAIVQKETSKIDERPIVAGLYLNRLKKGWPLQADPTIIYTLKQFYNKDTIIRRVLNKDLLIKSPYNTYLNKGLPPGPIAMPDVSSIDAVLNPAKHRYFFMCASTTKFGYHEFAKNSFQHAINAEKYRRWISKQGIRR